MIQKYLDLRIKCCMPDWLPSGNRPVRGNAVHANLRAWQSAAEMQPVTDRLAETQKRCPCRCLHVHVDISFHLVNAIEWKLLFDSMKKSDGFYMFLFLGFGYFWGWNGGGFEYFVFECWIYMHDNSQGGTLLYICMYVLPCHVNLHMKPFVLLGGCPTLPAHLESPPRQATFICTLPGQNQLNFRIVR